MSRALTWDIVLYIILYMIIGIDFESDLADTEGHLSTINMISATKLYSKLLNTGLS